jgi:hypothetical protein
MQNRKFPKPSLHKFYAKLSKVKKIKFGKIYGAFLTREKELAMLDRS